MTKISEQKSRIIAKAMCRATEKVLWPVYVDQYRIQGKSVSLRTRVGSGLATNHKSRADKHVITYGRKMVQSKIESYYNASEWTTGREIIKYNFVPLTLENVFVHTTLHEFGHFVQTILGFRPANSVHNKHFYSILQEFYQNGVNNRVRDYMRDYLAHFDIDLSEYEWSKADIADTKADVANAAHKFKRGDDVYFMHPKRGRIDGVVARVNRKTITVDTGVSEWRVRIPIVQPYDGGVKSASSTKTIPNRRLDTSKFKNYRKGQHVSFRLRSGRIIDGVVKRVNKKTLSVIPNDHSRGSYYRVPYSALVK